MSNFWSVKSPNLLPALVIISIAIAIFFSFFNYFIKKDFILHIKAPCNPEGEECFRHECDTEDPRCSQVSDKFFYYKIVEKKEKNINSCKNSDCNSEVWCAPEEDSCFVYYCTTENLEEFDLLDDSCS